MPRLDDFLQPLHQGVWEVSVPKEEVTEPLDEGWKKSEINLPSPGVLASYRKGQYHVHETEDEWKVHVDRYDPEEHPFLHLADDAPLVFMISGTFNAILFDSWNALEKGPDKMASEMKIGWQLMMIFGVAMIFLGVVVSINSWIVFQGLLDWLIPLVIIGFGILTIVNGLRVRPLDGDSIKRTSLGIGLVIIGAVFLYADFVWLAIIVLLVLAAWAFVSAALSLKRAAGGRLATPEGFYKRLAMGFLSLALGLLIFVAPRGVAQFLILILGILAILIGVSLIINGYGLRKEVLSMESEGDAIPQSH